jgi:hypothetical protein
MDGAYSDNEKVKPSESAKDIGKEGQGFNAMKTYYTNWCFLDIK